MSMHVGAVCARLLTALGMCCLAETALGAFKRAKITSLHVDSDIQFRYATTQVTSRLKNPHDQKSEALFDVTLPNEAFITNLTLEVDGQVMFGEIQGREEARRRYEAARDRGQSAGHIATRSRETNQFTLSVSVAPLGKVTFNLTYQELLRRKHGYYEQVVYIDPGQVVSDMQVRISVREARNITRLTVPPLRNDLDPNIADVGDMTEVERPSAREAIVLFSPTQKFQSAQAAGGLAGQFVLQYDVDRAMSGEEILLVNGYFVHFFAPDHFRPIPSDVLFILDVSGSMQGTKMQQLKTAMRSILGQLNAHDRFNIISFSNAVSVWRPEMAEVADEDAREEALLHVERLNADGWTDIEQALATGLELMRPIMQTEAGGEVRSPIIMFLTDGEPTSGVTGTNNILRSVKEKNEGHVVIFSLAFGEHADYDLVKKVSIQNHGVGRRIYEASDAAIQIAGFYSEIGVSLLSNLTFRYLDVSVDNVTRSHYTNYFNGSEIVICGRYDEEHPIGSLIVQVTASSEEGADMVLQETEDAGEAQGSASEPQGMIEEITEKVWAYLTIKQLLDEETAATDHGKRQILTDKIVRLALQYGFVTPHTSMVVTELADQQPNVDEQESGQDVQVGLSNVGGKSIGFADPAIQQGDNSYDPPMEPPVVRPPASIPRPSLPHRLPGRSNKWQRKQNKHKAKQSGRSAKPGLLVLLPSIRIPVCLSLANLGKPVLLYEDVDEQWNMTATVLRWHISEITLTYNGPNPHTTVISKKTWNMIGNRGTDGAPWTVRLDPNRHVAMVSLGAFNLMVTRGRKLDLVVSRTAALSNPKPVGTIGRLLTHGLQEISAGIFKTSAGRKYRAKMTRRGLNNNMCWKLKRFHI